MISSSSDEDVADESKIPPVEECQAMCNDFESVTRTNQAVAQYWLQRRDWDLKRALDGYFERQIKTKGNFASDDTAVISSLLFYTWNIDGLDAANLKARTLAVCRLIMLDNPDVVFLQEVVPESLHLAKEELVGYHFCVEKTYGYFNVTLLRLATVTYESHEVVRLRKTSMDRNMVATQAKVQGIKFAFLNVHLESTRDHAEVRVSQLRDGFVKMQSYPPDVTVIFAGDMNLRESELPLAGDIPSGVVDVWEQCGQRPNAEYTWDLKHNTNKQMSGRHQPRLRFDRIYFKYADPKKVEPHNFCICGVEKVPGLTCYPSDHWGLRAEFTFNLNKVEGK